MTHNNHSTTLFSLQIQDGISVDVSRAENKYLGRWDEIVWSPLIAVGSSLSSMIQELIDCSGFNGRVERKPPFARPAEEVIELGDDIVLRANNDIPAYLFQRLISAAHLFCLQIWRDADGISDSLDFSKCLEPPDREIVSKHVDIFLSKYGGKNIPEPFTFISESSQVVFAGRFARATVVPFPPSSPEVVIAKLEGAERSESRATCILVVNQTERKTAGFAAEPNLLVKVRAALWTNSLFAVRILETGTAAGKGRWELIDVMQCEQSGAPLIDEV